VKHVLVAAAFTIFVCVCSQAQKPKEVQSQTNQVLEANRQWLMAYENCDVKGIERLTAPDFVLSNFIGGLEAKPEFLTNIECDSDGLKPRVPELDEIRVLLFGEGAVVTCRSRSKEEGDAGLRYTNVFVKRQGKWLVISCQLTNILSVAAPVVIPIPPPGATPIKESRKP